MIHNCPSCGAVCDCNTTVCSHQCKKATSLEMETESLKAELEDWNRELDANSDRIWHRCEDGIKTFPAQFCTHCEPSKQEPDPRNFDAKDALEKAEAEVERMRSVIRKELSEPVVIGCDGTRCRLVPEAVLDEQLYKAASEKGEPNV